MAESNPGIDKLDAQLREAGAQLDGLRAKAQANLAGAAMDAIADRPVVDADVRDPKGDIARAAQKYADWDAAREVRFDARMDEAEAKLRLWKARRDERKADRAMDRHDALATLEERIAVTRGRLAAWKAARHDEQAQAQFEESVGQFEKAYEAAASRYEL